MRLFIAIELPREVKIKCLDIIEKLNESGANIRSVPRDNLHITVKFLGDTREDDVNKLQDIIKDISRKAQSFKIEFSTLGFFGNPWFPRTIWVGITRGKRELVNLMMKLNKETSFIRREEKEPSPHLTLARVKSPQNSENLLHIIQRNSNVKIGEIDVNNLVLVESKLTPHGPKYRTINSFKMERTISTNE